MIIMDFCLLICLSVCLAEDVPFNLTTTCARCSTRTEQITFPAAGMLVCLILRCLFICLFLHLWICLFMCLPASSVRAVLLQMKTVSAQEPDSCPGKDIALLPISSLGCEHHVNKAMQMKHARYLSGSCQVHADIHALCRLRPLQSCSAA